MWSKIGNAASSGEGIAAKGFNVAGEIMVALGDTTLKCLDFAVPWAIFVIGWLRWMLPLMALGYGLYQFYLFAQDYWREG